MIRIHPGLNLNSISFKQANVNIMAFSDNHGDLTTVPALYQNFYDNKEDIFQKKEDKSTLNVMAVVGDWFMNPMQGGYQTLKDKTSGDYQEIFLKSFIRNVKNNIPGLKTLYTPGNHCLDGGDKVLINHIKNINMDTIISNADLKNSKLINGLTPEQKERIQECKVLEVQDDKNPDLKHKVLVVGILPININYLVKEDISSLNILGAKNVKEADLIDADSEEVSNSLSEIVNKFKNEYPKSAVMLMNHSGEPAAKAIAKRIDCIDLILNAHDHQDKISYVNNKSGFTTKIISLSQNSEKLEAVNLQFDDDGCLSVKSKPFHTDFSKIDKKNPLQRLYENILKKDINPLFKINDPKKREYLTISNVRYANNDLANFCTDSIYSQLKNSYPELSAFFLASTTFRQNIPTSKTRDVINLDLIDLFKGISGSLSSVMVGEIQGNDLLSYVNSNIIDNLAAPSRNAINQYSGIQIDRSGLKEYYSTFARNQEPEMNEVSNYIKIKNADGQYEYIDPDKKYVVALPKKIFAKTEQESLKKYQRDFVDTDKKVSEYFNDFLKNSPKEIDLTTEQRIL